MTVRPEVRTAQRTLATLDGAHRRAATRLAELQAQRDQATAEWDRRIADAQADVDEAVAAMARDVSAELTAHLLGLELVEVRRLLRSRHPNATPSCAPGDPSVAPHGRPGQ